MGVVTIRAFHQSFGNAVMNRLRKLPANRCVARITKLGLRGFQQAARKPTRFVSSFGHLKEMGLSSRSITLTRILDSINKVS